MPVGLPSSVVHPLNVLPSNNRIGSAAWLAPEPSATDENKINANAAKNDPSATKNGRLSIKNDRPATKNNCSATKNDRSTIKNGRSTTKRPIRHRHSQPSHKKSTTKSIPAPRITRSKKLRGASIRRRSNQIPRFL